MWQVIINGPGYFDTQYELPDGETSLGRADENDIVLSGDLVSRRHAKLHAQGDELALEDLGSRNGSRLNGDALKGTVPLKAGDTLTVGENTLSVRQPQKAETASTEVVQTGVAGVHRFAAGVDLSSAVILAKNVNESFILRALDNILPFNPGGDFPVSDSDKTPRSIPYPSLAVLYKTAEKLSTAQSLKDFLEETTDRLMERVNATTAVVLLKNPSGAYVPASVRHRGNLAQGEVPVSDAIIEEALAKKAALAVSDVKDDQRFAGRESVILYGADRVLCVPVGHVSGFVGVLYLNCSHDEGSVESLLDLCNAVGHLIATGVEKFQLRERGQGEERLRRALERFHAPAVVEQRIQELASFTGGRLTQLDEKNLTTLIVEVSGFTALVGNLGAVPVAELLEQFYERVTGLLFSFEGTVTRVRGGSLMAVFGAPFSKADDAQRAVRAAIAIRDEWVKVMSPRLAKDRRAVRMGLNTGKALAGLIGSDARLEYTAVGESVDVAGWLCQVAEPGQVLITGKTLAAVGARFDVQPLGERALEGGAGHVAVFELLDEDVAQHTSPGV
jgi:adenylate cyclase